MGRWEEIALHEAQREKGQGEGRELERMKWEQARSRRVIAGTEGLCNTILQKKARESDIRFDECRREHFSVQTIDININVIYVVNARMSPLMQRPRCLSTVQEHVPHIRI
jgi:hypothetical protein